MKLRQPVIYLLTAILVLNSTILSNASTVDKTYNNTEITSEGKPCTVQADIGLTYSIKIPKLITLDSESKSADYKLTAWADLDASYYISIEPSTSTVALKQPNKESVNATITQSKTRFRTFSYINELKDTESIALEPDAGKETATSDNIITGKVSVDNISAGTWSGVFNFVITLNKTPAPSLKLAEVGDEGLKSSYESFLGKIDYMYSFLTKEDAAQRNDILYSGEDNEDTYKFVYMVGGYTDEELDELAEAEEKEGIEGSIYWVCEYFEDVNGEIILYLIEDDFITDGYIVVIVGDGDTLTFSGEEIETENNMARIDINDMDKFDSSATGDSIIRSTNADGEYIEMYVVIG